MMTNWPVWVYGMLSMVGGIVVGSVDTVWLSFVVGFMVGAFGAWVKPRRKQWVKD